MLIVKVHNLSNTREDVSALLVQQIPRNAGVTGLLACRRLLRNGYMRPQGVLPGHTEGVTHVSTKGDGRYFISNGKDCTLRLWDARKLRTGRAIKAAASQVCLLGSVLCCLFPD
jgi:WD40 repeat protein